MNRYLLLTAAMTAGYVLGEADLPGAQARAIEQTVSVKKTLGVAAKNTVISFIESQMCGQIESEFALSSGSCDMTMVGNHSQAMMIYWGDDWQNNDWYSQINQTMSGNAIFSP